MINFYVDSWLTGHSSSIGAIARGVENGIDDTRFNVLNVYLKVLIKGDGWKGD